MGAGFLLARIYVEAPMPETLDALDILPSSPVLRLPKPLSVSTPSLDSGWTRPADSVGCPVPLPGELDASSACPTPPWAEFAVYLCGFWLVSVACPACPTPPEGGSGGASSHQERTFSGVGRPAMMSPVAHQEGSVPSTRARPASFSLMSFALLARNILLFETVCGETSAPDAISLWVNPSRLPNSRWRS